MRRSPVPGTINRSGGRSGALAPVGRGRLSGSAMRLVAAKEIGQLEHETEERAG
jgi:hypothetical protein